MFWNENRISAHAPLSPVVRDELLHFLKKRFLICRSIIWYGSSRRNQATFYRNSQLSDCDFLVVSYLSIFYVHIFTSKAASYHSEKGLISVSFITPTLFGKLKSISMFEVKHNGLTISGEDLIDRLGHIGDSLPRWDGLRLLFYMLHELAFMPESRIELKADTAGRFYKLVRVYLNIARAYLVFHGCYHHDYEETLKRIEGLEDQIGPELFPKIVRALFFKLNREQDKINHIDVSEARSDLLSSLSRLLRVYLGNELDPVENISILKDKKRASPIYNILYSLRMSFEFRRPVVKPRVILKLNILHLNQIIYLALLGKHDQAEGEFERLFYIDYDMDNLRKLTYAYALRAIASDSELLDRNG